MNSCNTNGPQKLYIYSKLCLQTTSGSFITAVSWPKGDPICTHCIIYSVAVYIVVYSIVQTVCTVCVSQAIEFGYDVEIVEPDTAWRFKVAELTK